MSVKLLLYCTRAKPYLIYDHYDNSCGKCITADKIESYHLNGKIVAECNCQKVEKVFLQGGEEDLTFGTKSLFSIECKSCLDFEQLESYFGYNNDIWGYALHLSNVKVFDEPKELYEYDIKLTPQKLVNPISKDSVVISNINYSCTKAPQNMCNVYDRFGNHYILISIKPEWLCKILNGEKTIEVRKKILNSLKEVLGNENNS